MLDDLRDLYQEVILDHGRRPRNFRSMELASHMAQGHNPMCGDTLVIFLHMSEDGKITDCSFKGEGCAISMASASLMTEVLKGKTLSEATALFARFHTLCTGEEALLEVNGDVAVDDITADGVAADDVERLEVLAGVQAFPVRVKCATLAWHAMMAALEGKKEISTEND